MIIGILKQTDNEPRICFTPQIAKKFKILNVKIVMEKGYGHSLHYSDEDFVNEGVTIEADPQKILSSADLFLRFNKPTYDEINKMKDGATYISFLDPFHEKELVMQMKEKKLTAISVNMIPRTTIAQKMDGLSSQANLAGYVAVLNAAAHLSTLLPMMTTPSGTLSPAKVFIIGVGVAGLQAIATSRRLGASVEAFDTRAIVEEQVKSLGAKFLKIDLGETNETKQGYAKALTDAQLKKQKEEITKALAKSDIVITTAQVFGRKAPRIIDDGMIKQMKPGSIIIDMAVDSGGNVEGSKNDTWTEKHRVKIYGDSHLAKKVPIDASQMYATNLFNLLNHFFNKESKNIQLDMDSDILQSAVITHNGEITNTTLKEHYQQ